MHTIAALRTALEHDPLACTCDVCAWFTLYRCFPGVRLSRWAWRGTVGLLHPTDTPSMADAGNPPLGMLEIAPDVAGSECDGCGGLLPRCTRTATLLHPLHSPADIVRAHAHVAWARLAVTGAPVDDLALLRMLRLLRTTDKNAQPSSTHRTPPL